MDVTTWVDSSTSNLAGGVGAALVVSGISWTFARVRRTLRRDPPTAPAAAPTTAVLSETGVKDEVTTRSGGGLTAKDIASGALVVAGWLLILGASFWALAVAFGVFVTLVRKGVAFAVRAFRSPPTPRTGGADGEVG